MNPMPRDPPVTTATLPATENSVSVSMPATYGAA